VRSDQGETLPVGNEPALGAGLVDGSAVPVAIALTEAEEATASEIVEKTSIVRLNVPQFHEVKIAETSSCVKM
jgi:hypothetical protein